MGNKTDSNDSEKLTEAKKRYKKFLEVNPWSKIIELANDGGDGILAVSDPWDDPSLVIVIPDDDADLANSLNNVLLHHRYTAIYHTDRRALEVIWTAYKLDDTQSDIVNRKFTLDLPDSKVECEFTDSSERLLEIAKNAVPIEVSPTGFRNLQSFGLYARNHELEDKEKMRGLESPRSFWIKDIDWSDEKVIDLVRHVNFAIRYYDSYSPVIQIHSVSTDNDVNTNRYLEGFGFPEVISLPNLDSKLMVLFESGFAADSPSTSFLNLFRVVEYVAFDYTQETARKEIQKIISEPHALHNSRRTAVELMHITKAFKGQKDQDVIPYFLRDIIEPKKLWKEISPNKDVFAESMEFDGGLVIKPLITAAHNAETFGTSAVEQFGRDSIKIRNGLAHGRDKVTADSILPTSKNLAMLKPWVNVLSFCAGEVVLYAAHH